MDHSESRILKDEYIQLTVICRTLGIRAREMRFPENNPDETPESGNLARGHTILLERLVVNLGRQ
jgi:hypothetical protein